jgi:hypothetical protein
VNAPQRWPSQCAAPGCHVALPDYNGRGRPRLYCSPRCRSAGRGARSNTPLSVEVDHTVASDAAGRPIGRVWLVRLMSPWLQLPPESQPPMWRISKPS